jgi:hypothetical protein
MKKFLFVLIFLFVAGCSQSVPQWVNAPAPDNQTYLYASAEGGSKKEAINEALSFIASKLQVNVSSIFESTKGYYETSNKKNYFQKVKNITISKIRDIPFINYEILKMKKTDDKYYVLIRINRRKNANFLIEKSKNELRELTPLLGIKDKIKILKIYPQAIKKLNETISNLYIAQTLYPSTEIKKLIILAIKLKNAFEEKLNGVSFFIVKSNFSNFLKEVFNSLNLNTSQKGIKVYSHASYSYAKAAGYYVTTIRLLITLKDRTSYTISLTCSGNSISGFNLAKDFAIKNCERKIKTRLLKIFKKSD